LPNVTLVCDLQPEQWKKVRRNLESGGEILTRPPKGFAPDHLFIADVKRKDFVAAGADGG
jgi:hypothetical protein